MYVQDFIVAVAKQALFISLILTTPAVLVAMIVGLVISIVQATTQIQETTLTFVPKLVAVVLTLAVSGSWMLVQLMAFTSNIFNRFPDYIK